MLLTALPMITCCVVKQMNKNHISVLFIDGHIHARCSLPELVCIVLAMMTEDLGCERSPGTITACT